MDEDLAEALAGLLLLALMVGAIALAWRLSWGA